MNESTQFINENDGNSLFLRGLAADLGVSSAKLTAGFYSLVNKQQDLSEDPQNCRFVVSGTTVKIAQFFCDNGNPSRIIQFHSDFHGYHVDSIKVGLTGVGTIGDDPKLLVQLEGTSKEIKEFVLGSQVARIPVNTVISDEIKLTFDSGGLEPGDKIKVTMTATAYVPGESFRAEARKHAASEGLDLMTPYRDLSRLIMNGAGSFFQQFRTMLRGGQPGTGQAGGGTASTAVQPTQPSVNSMFSSTAMQGVQQARTMMRGQATRTQDGASPSAQALARWRSSQGH